MATQRATPAPPPGFEVLDAATPAPPLGFELQSEPAEPPEQAARASLGVLQRYIRPYLQDVALGMELSKTPAEQLGIAPPPNPIDEHYARIRPFAGVPAAQIPALAAARRHAAIAARSPQEKAQADAEMSQ